MPLARVDLAALRKNLELLRGRLPADCRFLAAVKANAYGHGALPVARALEAAGVEWFGVATPGEALELRAGGVTARVLLLGPAQSQLSELVTAGISLTVPDNDSLDTLLSSNAPGPARVHLKVDTGMGRIGHPPGQRALALARRIGGEPRVELEGVWTHFAKADEPDRAFTERQIGEFEAFLDDLRTAGVDPELVHACNSAGLLGYPHAHYDMVRVGIALYGYPPGNGVAAIEPALRPVMSLTAPITFVKRVAAGTPVSYGATWRAARETTIATVRFGYADGYPRALANRGWARIGDTPVAVAGRICMDQLMLDVGDLEVRPGDRVTLLGSPAPTAHDLGELAGTISYEILTSVATRVERSYID